MNYSVIFIDDSNDLSTRWFESWEDAEDFGIGRMCKFIIAYVEDGVLKLDTTYSS